MIRRRTIVIGAGAFALWCIGLWGMSFLPAGASSPAGISTPAWAATPAAASSDAACRNAWTQSGASSSCYAGSNGSGAAFVEWRSNRQECIVSAYCTISSGSSSRQYNQVYATVSDTRHLKNCDGDLKQNC